MGEDLILFRPHHFMCTLGFQGMGYSPVFVQNYKDIVDRLNSNPHSLIQVVKKHDSICDACPLLRKDSGCRDAEKVDSIDKRHLEALNLQYNQVISWDEAKQILKHNMTEQKFEHACDGCKWKAYGVCSAALNKLKE